MSALSRNPGERAKVTLRNPGIPQAGRSNFSLETQPNLELNHAAGQSAAGLAKVRIVDGHVAGVTSERGQVQLVEEVEKIGAEVQLGRFTFEKGHRRGFGKAHVNRLVPRAAERIAVNKRRACRADIEVGRSSDWAIRCGAVSTGDDAWEVAIGLLEGVRAVVASSFAEVCRRESRAERASSRDGGAIIAFDRRPGKTSVVLESSIHVPAAQGFPHQVMTVLQKR